MAGYNNSITDINSKVGIGTGQTEPSSKLDVDGVIRSRGGSYEADVDTREDVGLIIPENNFIYTADGFSYLRKLIGKTGDVITIGEAGTSLIDGISLLPGTTGGFVRIYNNASVVAKFVNEKLSLGMTDPQQKLHIVDTDGANIILNSNTGAENNGIWMTEGGIATPYANGAYTHYDSTNNAFKINTGTSTLYTRFTIARDTGHVGIGTDDPGTRLDVFNGNDFTDTLDVLNMVRLKRQNNDGDGQVNGIYMGVSGNNGTSNSWAGIVAKQAGSTSNNTDLIFTTRGDSDSIQERMSIGPTGVVLINNSLGINVTSVSTGYKLDIGGGDVYVRQAVAKISLGQFGSQGDAHFGASGIGSPTVGSQDYGFYSAHNAYRTSTGAWKHSRTSAIGAVRILGGGGGSSGNAGFSFDYSANDGTNDITWTNLMHLSTGGNLQLPSYGAGILQSDGNGTITSVNSISISGDIVMGDNLINYPFSPINNQGTQYWLLCFNSASNDVNGSIIGDRTSGHHQAMNLDIVVSSKNNSMQTGMISSQQVLEANEQYTLVTLTYDSNNYVAIKYEGHAYPSSGSYFTGLLKSSIGSDFLLALNPTQVSAVAAFSNANTKATIQANKVGIDTADPKSKLHIVTGSGGTYNPNSNHDDVTIEGSGNIGLQLFSPNTTYQYIAFGDPDSVNAGYLRYHHGTNEMVFRTNGSDNMRMTSGGNVGIGVTVPGAKLHVLGSVILDGYSTSDPDSTSRTAYPADQMFTHYANNGVSIIGGEGGYDGTGLTIGEETTRSDAFKFIRGVSDTNGGANAAEEFWVNGVGDAYFAGNVGINTTTPSYMLDVRDGTTSGAIARFTAINPHVIIESSTAGAAVLHFKPNQTGNKSGQFKVTAGNGYNFRWSNDAAGTGEVSYMTLDTSTTGGGDLTVKGDVIAYGAPSDRKYKENIKPIESALDKAMQLQGVTFDWKEADSILDIKEDIGFIAQDVEKVLPELVRDSGKGNLSLRYQGITPVLLEAIKELKAEIDLLKSKPCNCNNCNCSI